MAITITNEGGASATQHSALQGLNQNDHEAVYVQYIQNGAGGQIRYQYDGASPASPADGYLWWEVVSA